MTININELINHPERLDRQTLFGLRELVARCPYYQAARILFLQNLFLLHDATFGEELRRTSLYIPDRSVLFQLVEGLNYELRSARQKKEVEEEPPGSSDRTVSLIDRFLATTIIEEQPPAQRKGMPLDAATDYASYLKYLEQRDPSPSPGSEQQQRRSELIDDFIGKNEKIILQETPEYTPELEEGKSAEEQGGDEYFTETFAKIYIKQGKYEKAIEIIRQLAANYPKKNAYFADQIRFLQKLIINNKNKID